MSSNPVMIDMAGVSKSFVMHLQGGMRLPVIKGISLAVRSRECVVLGGPSGTGKSSVLKMIYGNYRCDEGDILVRDGAEWVNVASAGPRRVAKLRQTAISYVSQFLKVIPRVDTLEIVAAAARQTTGDPARAQERATYLLTRLRIPERLWRLPPATFSGGEQQRINIARGLAAERPILLLDEPTASLDAANRATVIELLAERKAAGVALVGIFHDDDARRGIADRIVDITAYAA